MIDYTTVIGVDQKHLQQLKWTWPTWMKHKPSLLNHPLVVFYDQSQVVCSNVLEVVRDHPNPQIYPWPLPGVEYDGGDDKWSNPQRYKMLAGFIHVSTVTVKTPYWLKLDTDVVAVGMDNWIDDGWFVPDPGIVAHHWSFTKPPDQMMQLDAWAEKHIPPSCLPCAPLNLQPQPGASRLGHKRIISQVGFFSTSLTRTCSNWAQISCGAGQLPVPSQDGFMWYMARRLDMPVVRVNMKGCGWQPWSTDGNVKKYAEDALK